MVHKMIETSNVTITVYEIHSQTESISEPDLSVLLFDALNRTNTIRDRLMPLSKSNDNKDNDFIASFSSSSGYLFGSFARLRIGEESVVPKTVLDKKTASLNEMISESTKNTEGSIRGSSFFCIYKSLLAVTNAHVNIRALEAYINWVLKQHMPDSVLYRLIPKKNSATTISIGEVKSIQLADTFINAQQNTKTQMFNLKDNVLKKFMNDIKSVDDFNMEDIVSATLTLKFNRKKLQKEKALDTALKIIDSEDIIINGRNGKRIRGTEFFVKATRKIEKSGKNLYNEMQIETEMQDILKKVQCNEVVS